MGFRKFRWVFFAFAVACKAQDSKPNDISPRDTAHGTVNIILANRNGLVAVTDSNLTSSMGGNAGEAQKLFLLDDHTLCTIAGWYSNPGPRLPNGNYPLGVEISRIIRDFIASTPNLTELSVSAKADVLARLLVFCMSEVEETDIFAGQPATSTSLELSVAGSEHGHFQIVRIDVDPDSTYTPLRYAMHPVSNVTVNDELVLTRAGLTKTVDWVLNHPERGTLDGPNIAFLRESVVGDHGRDLTLDDMTKIANTLERMTAHQLEPFVGGQIQTGAIEKGKARLIDERHFQDHPGTHGVYISIVSGGVWLQDPSKGMGSFPLAPDKNGGMVADHIEAHGIIVPLDRMFFYNSKFIDCMLTYSGSINSVFDSSNSIAGCKLGLTDISYRFSPLVNQFRKDYPDVPVVLVTMTK